jgi:hypothetical protein
MENRMPRAGLAEAVSNPSGDSHALVPLMTDWQTMFLVFVVHPKLIDQRSAGLVEPLHVDLCAELAEFEHDLIQYTDGGDIPEVRIRQIDVDVIEDFDVVEIMYKLIGEAKNTRPFT